MFNLAVGLIQQIGHFGFIRFILPNLLRNRVVRRTSRVRITLGNVPHNPVANVLLLNVEERLAAQRKPKRR
jgi:hypothetical protein